jgi:hypothetical protein
VVKEVIDRWWPTAKKDDIFEKFIEKERNSLLKTYMTQASLGHKIHMSNGFWWFETDAGQVYQHKKEGDCTIVPAMMIGNIDAYETADRAVGWWKDQLDFIEKEACRLNKQRSGQHH